MAAVEPCDSVSHNHVVAIPKYPTNEEDDKQQQTQVTENDNTTNNNNVDYWKRAQWLRAAVLGANDGLVSVSSLMMGVGAVKTGFKAMLLAGFAGLVAGACGMAIGEFVSVYTQLEVEVGQMMRDMDRSTEKGEKEFEMEMEKRKSVPNPLQAALASAFSFAIGGLVPLLSGAFTRVYKIRIILIVTMASLALVVFGRVGAQLGKTPKLRSCTRFLLGGWMAMAVTFGLTKLLGSSGLEL